MAENMPDDMPDDATEFMEQLSEIQRLSMSAKAGTLSDDAQTRSFIFEGPTKAEALGRAYSLRDGIRDGGYDCEATIIEEVDGWSWMDERHWRVELRINQ
jgi:hypothetical protein